MSQFLPLERVVRNRRHLLPRFHSPDLSPVTTNEDVATHSSPLSPFFHFSPSLISSSDSSSSNLSKKRAQSLTSITRPPSYSHSSVILAFSLFISVAVAVPMVMRASFTSSSHSVDIEPLPDALNL
ncbi:hypothetical protein TcWFU_002743 [Taenia crassiceps]|uniref:Transmembrane protein n=1 Tax=Taenia crassiceps TaxID=6207 RepID=A0ABR4QAV0_9CEST